MRAEQDVDRARNVRRFFMRTVRPFARVAGAGYGVLGLFALAFAVVRAGWPDVSVGNAIALAGLIAAPMALALVWNRLSGLKVYGVEVSLTQASTQLDAELVDAATNQYYSDNRHLIPLISKSLIERREELVEIPLRRPEKPYWWSTRLFLIAALAQDYSRVRALVFVDGDDRRLVGLATPQDVRLAFGRRFPSLEAVYANIRVQFAHIEPATEQVEKLIDQWTTSTFLKDGRSVSEVDFKVEVSRVSLREWMAEVDGLNLRCVQWKGFQDRALLAEIVNFDSPYVPLVEDGRLYKVVSRGAVVEEVAAKALK